MTFRTGDMVKTPHATNGRMYRVVDLSEYPAGQHCNLRDRVLMQEIGTGNDPIYYPATFLTYCGRFG